MLVDAERLSALNRDETRVRHARRRTWGRRILIGAGRLDGTKVIHDALRLATGC
jgi:hypothetical protein